MSADGRVRLWEGHRLLWLALGALGLYDLIYLAVWLGRGIRPPFGDFFALWSFSAFVQARPAAGLYDPAGLQAFQVALEPAFHEAYPFLYPPTFLLLIAPLALLPIGLAWLVWSAGSAVLYLAAALPRCGRVGAGAALLVAPTTLISLVGGQSGLLSAAALLGGLRLLPRRPWLAGAVLGLLTLKPQLGLLVPVALLAAGAWRAIVAAAAVAAGLVVATGLAFGWPVWAVWWHGLPDSVALVLRNRGAVARIMPTLSAGLFQLGVADGATQILQAVSVLVAMTATWWAWRAGPGVAGIAVLAMATFLATPYGYIYDLPMVTGAMVLLLARPTERVLALVLGLVAWVPLVMVRAPLPLVMPGLLGLAIVLVLCRGVAADR